MSGDLVDRNARHNYVPGKDSSRAREALATAPHAGDGHRFAHYESVKLSGQGRRCWISNRQICLVESGLSYCKQKTVIGPNRQIFEEREFARKAFHTRVLCFRGGKMDLRTITRATAAIV